MPTEPDPNRLAALGWDPERAAGFPPAADGLVPARALEIQRGHVLVDTGAGPPWPSPVPSSLRLGSRRWPQPGPPATGDWLAVEPGGAVRGILSRSSLLRRFDETAGDEVLVANADLAIVVSSLNADYNLARLERLLAIADEAGVPRVLALSKCDLAPEDDDTPRRAAAELGVRSLAFSARTGAGLDELGRLMAPRTTSVLIGSSGVGKSTLVNRLLGREARRTLAVREHDDKGRHATTSRTLLELPGGALVVDTPGLRSPRPASAAGLPTTFADVYDAAADCRFADCRHEAEPGCGVRAEMDAGRLPARRLEALRKLESEIERAQDGPAMRRGRRSRAAVRR